MKKFNIATEKGIRYLEEDNVLFYFIAIEFIFKKEDLKSGNYQIIYKSNNHVFFKQNLQINVLNKSVKIQNSHEDPLIESEEYFFVCGQLTNSILENNKVNSDIECFFYFNDELLRKETINNEILSYLFSFNDWRSRLINEKEIYTNDKCMVRMHLGKKNKEYKEEEFEVNEKSKISFANYLLDYDYVAVQCSYDVDYDLEEKHVLKGLKGICNSDYLEENNETYYPIIPFSKKYANKSKNNYILINKINDLLKFYEENLHYVNLTFEMDEKFLLPFYKKYKTTSIGKIYSSLNSKKNHLDGNCCELCNEKSKCLQLVPSGLSESLFRKNLLVENFENCYINKIIKIVKE